MRRVLSLIFILLSWQPAFADGEEFPQRIRGFWGDKQVTCDILKRKGPAYLRSDQRWLKIGTIDVLGSTQGRYLKEMPEKLSIANGAELSFEIQTFYVPTIFEELTLSRDGFLFETIVSAQASGKYQRC